jgi:hypothetical protein
MPQNIFPHHRVKKRMVHQMFTSKFRVYMDLPNHIVEGKGIRGSIFTFHNKFEKVRDQNMVWYISEWWLLQCRRCRLLPN